MPAMVIAENYLGQFIGVSVPAWRMVKPRLICMH